MKFLRQLHSFIPLPVSALFLALGLLVNAIAGGVQSGIELTTVTDIGVIALIFILFDGGFSSSVHKVRSAIWPITILGLVGTALTTFLVYAVAHHVLGLPAVVSVLVGIALAPTDPAAVFSVLGPLKISGRSGTVIEGESGANDPVAIALMVGAIAYYNNGSSVTGVGVDFAQQLLVGIGAGVLIGLIGMWLPGKLRLDGNTLLPIAVVGFAFVAYELAHLVDGSGFLAALIAGVLIGDRFDSVPAVARFSSACAGLSEILIFTLLGLTIDLHSVPDEILYAVTLFVVLTFVIRPAVIFALLWKSKLNRQEKMFVSWGGIKGAVPILVAGSALNAGIDGSTRAYSIVFVAVACSILLQGSTLPALVRKISLVSGKQ